jgi:thiamine biosynthesis lipoprotein
MIADSSWGWYGLCFRAMNTGVEIQLYTNNTQDGGGDGLMADVQRMFDKAEKCLTRFDPRSELSQLNRSSGRRQRVSSLLFDVVEAAVWAASVTDGLFDPTLLKVMEAIGYDRSFEWIELRNQAAVGTNGHTSSLPPPHPGQYRTIGLNRVRGEITLPPDVQLDLGGIGKGWTVDRSAEWLVGRGPFMINAGGDLYAYGAPPDLPGWSVGIVDPWQPERDIACLQVRQRAVATSTISRRQWRRGERTMHHLIDPRTGQPAETDAVSVTVVAHRAALAEVYAKAALILGVDAGRAFLNDVPEVEGLFIQAGGELIFTDGFTAYLR